MACVDFNFIYSIHLPNLEIYNQFVPDDRVLYAYKFLEDDRIIAVLQVADAISHMKNTQEAVIRRKKQYWYPRRLLLILTLIAGSILLFVTPNDKIEMAKQHEKEIKLAAEAEKELEEKIKKEKDPEVKKILKEIKDKLADKKTAEEALKELAKQTKNIELKELKEKEKQTVLENWKAELKKSGLENLEKLINQKNLEAIEKELTKLNEKWSELSEEQKKALSQLAQKEEQLTEKELSHLVEQIESALDSQELLKELAAAAESIKNTGMELQNQMNANGFPPGQLAFAPPNQTASQGTSPAGQSNTNNGTVPKTGQNSQGSSSGNGTGGNGSGSDNGNGGGSGTGTGSGSSSGSGGGGTGSGAGTGQGSREMLTIPDQLAGKENLESDHGTIGEGQSGQQLDGLGPILKGTIRPYSEVYGEYEESYRQSTDRYKLPVDLEEIVKNYFTNIDPNKE